MQETKKLHSEISQQPAPETASPIQPAAGETEAPTPLSGTKGRIPKYLDSMTLGDSGVWEDNLGDVYFSHDIGLAGAVRTGVGVRFPDGSVQTTAASSAIAHDDTLAGNGTPAQPLAVASIKHDATLTGKGTSPLPLGVAVPLTLTGSTDRGTALISATNTNAGYGGKFIGGPSSSLGDNVGVFVAGGSPASGFGGHGVYTMGGDCGGGSAGNGIISFGGRGKVGGTGIDAFAGFSTGTGTNKPAGRFWGNVEIYHYDSFRSDGNLLVSGTVTAGTGMFTIDHPLDPENKSLHHSSVASPDMMNVYNGNITTDAGGEAVVELPDYFEALNQDFRYQLTVIGQFAQAIVASEIKENRFLIKTNAPNVKVSWQVTGIRHDAFAKAHAVKAEADKPAEERGYYLHPAEHEQPEAKGVYEVRSPEIMRRMKEVRDNAQPDSGQ